MGEAPSSAEGGHRRCFRNLLVCSHALNITRWPLHSYGMHLADTYRPLLPPQAAALVGQPSAIRRASSGGATVLSVVFQQRPDDGTRQLLNAAELVEQCNAWEHTTAGGRTLRARCWEVGRHCDGCCLSACLHAPPRQCHCRCPSITHSGRRACCRRR